MSYNEEDFRVPADEVASAGLRAQGVYFWRVEASEPGSSKIYDSNNNDTGETTPSINVRLKPVAYAEYDEESGNFVEMVEYGENDKPPRQLYKNLKIHDEGDSQRLSTAYEVITGRAPVGRLDEDSGTYKIDFVEVSRALLNGKFWGALTWFKLPDGKDKGKILEIFEKRFRARPPARFTPSKIEDNVDD